MKRAQILLTNAVVIAFLILSLFSFSAQAQDGDIDWDLVYVAPFTEIMDLQEFGGYLYAGGDNGHYASQIIRFDGDTWSNVGLSEKTGHQIASQKLSSSQSSASHNQ